MTKPFRGSPGNAEPFLSSASLRARAISALTRREHSRQELEKKLGPLAESADQLNEVLTQLEQERLLSDDRYAESVARVRGARFGAARIRFELQQKGVPPHALESVLAGLHESEADRVRQVWEKKFGAPPADAQEAARQQRFLMQRGFSSEVIGRLMRGLRSR